MSWRYQSVPSTKKAEQDGGAGGVAVSGVFMLRTPMALRMFMPPRKALKALLPAFTSALRVATSICKLWMSSSFPLAALAPLFSSVASLSLSLVLASRSLATSAAQGHTQ